MKQMQLDVFRVRIRPGSVKPKAQHQPVVVEHPSTAESAAIAERMVEHAIELASDAGMLGGYAIVTWHLDGTFNRAIRFHTKSNIGVTAAPVYVAEVMRRITTADVVYDVLNSCKP